MIISSRVSYGSDPELFLKRDDKIIGSERVIPIHGLGGIIRDGIQVEFNPQSAHTVRQLGDNIAHSFVLLRNLMKEYKGVEICWEGTVDVDKSEIDALSPASKRLGCAPSENVYGAKGISVDPLTYLKRSSGGHIHIGLGSLPELFHLHRGVDERPNIVPLLDIFVGNTCVLLDRDKNAAVRRENYGRAGEYRRPAHGLEYRTISSFWLRSYTLMSLVMGLSNFAVSIAQHTKTYGEEVENELLKIVKIDNFIRAIDTNDFDLAMGNFESLIPFMKTHMAETGFEMSPSRIEAFVAFAKTVEQYGGLEPFFDRDVVGSWTARKFCPFSTFL